jgi:hypothetical protein
MTDPYERETERALDVGLREAGLKGAPLQRRYYGGPPTLESYLRSAGGPLPYMARLRRIEDETARHERELAAARGGLERAYAGQPERLERVWAIALSHWDFSVVNDLIERHNRWYPIEARLPMDPRTRDYALVRGRPYWRSRLTVEWADAQARAALRAA